MTTWVYIVYEKRPTTPLESVLGRLREIRKKSLFFADRFLVDGLF